MSNNTNNSMNDFLTKTYTEINDNIKFSEAKNAALVTLNSALISACSSKVFDADIAFLWRFLIALVTLSLIIPLSLSISSFIAATGSDKGITNWIVNRYKRKHTIEKSNNKYMFYSYISGNYSEPLEYLKDIYTNVFNSNNNADKTSVDYQLSSQIIDLSNVAYRKFALFNIAVIIECTIFSFGGIGALGFAIWRIVEHYS